MVYIYWNHREERFSMESSTAAESKLDPRIKNVWRINDGLWIILIALVCILPFVLMTAGDDPDVAWVCSRIMIAELVAAAVHGTISKHTHKTGKGSVLQS